MSTKSVMEEERINAFRQVTGADPSVARQYLDISGWDVGRAVGLYMDSDDSDSYSPQPTGGGLFIGRRNSPIPGSESPTPSTAPAQSTPSQSQSTSKKPTAAGEKPRFMSFSDLRESDDDPSKEQSFFTGGEKSGIEVIDPKDRTPDIVGKVFDSVRRIGAKETDDPSTGKPNVKSQPDVFTGNARKLGDASTPSSVVSRPSQRTATPEPSSPPCRAITFWRNGFTVDDGTIRPYNDPANRAFLSDIQSGRVPRELEQSGAREVEVKLVDQKDRDWEAPKVEMKPFSGTGKRLGSTGTTLADIQQQQHQQQQQSVSTSTTTSTSTPSIQAAVDPSQPTTSIQIRLQDGTRLVGNFNLNNTVRDLYAFVSASKPHTPAFTLMTTFPNKPLTKMDATLSEEQLDDAVVVQKYK